MRAPRSVPSSLAPLFWDRRIIRNSTVLVWTRLLRSTEQIRLSSILHLSKLNFRAEKSQKDAAQYYKFAEEHATKGILKFSGNQGEVRPAARFAAHLRLGKIPSNISELFEELVTFGSFE